MNAHRPTRSDNVGRVGDSIVRGLGRFSLKRIGLIAIALVALATNAGTARGDWEQTQKLTADDTAACDGFGLSVSAFGDKAVIGAYGNDDNGEMSGSAYVFRHDGTGWVQEAKLLPSDGAADDWFGYSVSILGDAVVIGAVRDDDNGSKAGSAYVFRYDGTGWVQDARLLASDGAAQDYFGAFVAIFGDAAVIGAPGDDDNGDLSGSAYVFRYDGTGWVEEAKLLAPFGAAEDVFGDPVAISGNTAIIGAHGDHSFCGSAHMFRFDGACWVYEAKLRAFDGAAQDYFGASVAISGDTAVIGAFGDDDNGDYSGSAYVFRHDGTDWVEEAKLLASDGAAEDRFGHCVSILGDAVLIGAVWDDGCGSAYVFRHDGAGWLEEAKLLASDGTAGDRFGHSIALLGDAVVIGAVGDDDNGYQSGSAYIFERAQCPADFDGDGDVDTADLLHLLGAWGTPDGDVDGDGDTDTTDLLALLAAWGDCP